MKTLLFADRSGRRRRTLMNLMKKNSGVLRKFWNDEAGQGTAEYVLLLVLVVAIVMAFGGKLKGFITDKVSSVGDNINNFNP